MTVRPEQWEKVSEVFDALRPMPAEDCSVSNSTTLRSTLRAELDAILLMARRREPSRRYGTVAAFSDDLLRYLNGLPVAARPDTLGYRVRKFAQRRRGLVVGGALASVAIVAGTSIALLAAATAMAAQRDSAGARQQLRQIQTDYGQRREAILPAVLQRVRVRLDSLGT